MSAPRTNLERQRRRHWVPLLGMALVAAFGVLLIVYWLFEEAAESDQPQGSAPPPIGSIETAPTATEPPDPAAPVQGIDTPGATTPTPAPEQPAPAP